MSAVGKQPPFALMFLVVLLIPLQGAFNFFIYMRPRYAKFRKYNPNKSTLGLLAETLLGTFRVHREEGDGDDLNMGKKLGDMYATTASVLHSVVVSRTSAVQQRKSAISSTVVPVNIDDDGSAEAADAEIKKEVS